MESIRLDPLVAWILRLALAALFATAVTHKIRDPLRFKQTLADYEILPPVLVGPTWLGLVVAEVSIVLGLLLTGSAGTGLAAGGLLAVYGAAIGINLARGRRDIDCGCLGPAARQPLSAWLLARNGVLALGALATALPTSGRSLHPIDAISLLGGLIVLALLFNTLNLFVAQAARGPGASSRSLRPNRESLS